MSRSQPVLPYRVLPREAVVPSAGWSVIVDEQVVALVSDGDALPMWDAKLSFRMERHLRIDDDVAKLVGLDVTGSCCEAVVSLATGGGTSRMVVFRQPVAAGRLADVHIVIEPPSDHLANELHLTTGIYLAKNTKPRDALAPQEQGSRLWEMHDTIRLEGGAARLPMYEIPFSAAFPGDGFEHADFHVEIAEEPELEVAAALTVYLNSERPDFIHEVGVQGSAAERRLWSGVLSRVLVSAILSDDLLTAPIGESNTLASTVQRWAGMIWPDVALEHLRDMSSAGFAKREAQIESWLNALIPRSREGGGQ